MALNQAHAVVELLIATYNAINTIFSRARITAPRVAGFVAGRQWKGAMMWGIARVKVFDFAEMF